MTPKPKFKSKIRPEKKGNVVDNPSCAGRPLFNHEATEMGRQMSFVNKAYDLQSAADAICVRDGLKDFERDGVSKILLRFRLF